MDQTIHNEDLYLGVDQSLASTGWCITNAAGDLIDYDLLRISPASDPKNKKREIPELHPALEAVVGGGEEWLTHNKPMQQYFMAAAVRNMMRNMHIRYNCTRLSENHVMHVCLEGLGFGSTGDAARSLAGLQFMLIDGFYDAFADDYMIKFADPTLRVATPTTVKKFATGKGNASKEEIFDALPDRIKEEFSKIPKSKGRYDLADAYWLSRYGYEMKGKENAT